MHRLCGHWGHVSIVATAGRGVHEICGILGNDLYDLHCYCCVIGGRVRGTQTRWDVRLIGVGIRTGGICIELRNVVEKRADFLVFHERECDLRSGTLPTPNLFGTIAVVRHVIVIVIVIVVYYHAE